jgi:Sporulation and spore germination
MIPRYQKILFSILLTGILLMGTILFYEHKRAEDRLAAAHDATPIAAPADASTETIPLDLANDADGSITAVERQLALPEEPSVRARALLERLLAEYALPKSAHPLASGAAVDDVFLLKLPISSPTPQAATGATKAAASESRSASESGRPGHSHGELAVINLRGSFVDKHPSGVTVETLTLDSILGTLHANFPEITQVRFLVDGQPHDTLAGHIDLTRVYPVGDTTRSAQGTPTPDQTSAPTNAAGDPQ